VARLLQEPLKSLHLATTPDTSVLTYLPSSCRERGWAHQMTAAFFCGPVSSAGVQANRDNCLKIARQATRHGLGDSAS
jgi:hypothetical protein